jgi:hypothetical protein
MFRCESCNRVAPPKKPANKVVVERRECAHAPRSDANSHRPRRRRKAPRDPGGAGKQIVREMVVCDACAEELTSE